MEKVKLSDIIQETITGEWGTDIKKDENDVYVIRTADFCNDGTINYDKVEKRNIAEKKIKEKSLVIGDIIIEKSGGTDKNPVGRVVLFDKENYKCLANNFTQVLRVKNEYYYKYIFYQLFYKYKCGATLQMFNQTTGIQNLQMKIYLNQKLNTYIKEEQIEIANKLDKVQEIIGIRKKQIEELDELIKSQFVEMFKDKNFEKKEIRELVDRNIIKAKKKFSNGEKIKYIDISSIDNTKNQVIGFNEFEMGKEPSRAQQCLEKNDILISTVRPNLKNVAVNRYDDNNIVGTSGFCVLRPIKCLQEYLLYIVLSEEFTSDMISKTTGANYPAISNNDVLDYKIELPPLELQNQFAEFVKLIDKQKFEIQKNLEEMQKLQESLMNKYFG